MSGMDLGIRHGYTLADVDRLATMAAGRNRWYSAEHYSCRYDTAWSAICLHLYAADSCPDEGALFFVGVNAIARDSEDTRRLWGTPRNGIGTVAEKAHFRLYWEWHALPPRPVDETVVDRLALAQIWPTLTPRERESLAALAALGSYQAAADSLGLTYDGFRTHIGRARARFRALWHEGETPSRPWGRDRRSSGAKPMRTRLAQHRRSRAARRALLVSIEGET